jgi:hypothetical protein
LERRVKFEEDLMGSLIETSIRNGTRRNQEGVPPSPSPERPPLAPHDPPDPAPQAAAWERALRVIFMEASHHGGEAPKSRPWRANKRGRAVIKNAAVLKNHGDKRPHRH